MVTKLHWLSIVFVVDRHAATGMDDLQPALAARDLAGMIRAMNSSLLLPFHTQAAEYLQAAEGQRMLLEASLNSESAQQSGLSSSRASSSAIGTSDAALIKSMVDGDDLAGDVNSSSAPARGLSSFTSGQCWCGGFVLRSAVLHRRVWRAGGHNGNRTLTDEHGLSGYVCGSGEEYNNEVWSHAPAGVWARDSPGPPYPEVPAPMWSPRHSFGFVGFAGRLWVIGGEDEAGIRRDVWSSEDGTAWSWLTNAQFTARKNFAALEFSDDLLILGGEAPYGELRDVWSTQDGVAWTQVTSSAQWSARSDFGATVFDGFLWVMGGFDGATPLSDVWRSSNGVTWEEVASEAAWGPRIAPGVVAFASRLWLVGGYMLSPTESLAPRPRRRHWSPSGSVVEVHYPSKRIALSDLSFAGGSGLAVTVTRVRDGGLAASLGVKAGNRLVSVLASDSPIDTSNFEALSSGGISSLAFGLLTLGFTDPQSAQFGATPIGLIPQGFRAQQPAYAVDGWSSEDGIKWQQEFRTLWPGEDSCRDAFSLAVEESGPEGRERRLLAIGAFGREPLYRSRPVYYAGNVMIP